MPETVNREAVISVELEKDGYRKMIRSQGEYEDHVEDGWHPSIGAAGIEEPLEIVEIKLIYEEGDRDSLVDAAMREYGLKLSKQFKLENLIAQVAEWESNLAVLGGEPPTEDE